MTPDAAIDIEISKNKLKCQKALYAQTENLDERDIVLFHAFNALNPNDPCPNVSTTADVSIAKTQERNKSFRSFFSNLIPFYGVIWGNNDNNPVIVEPKVYDQKTINPLVIGVNKEGVPIIVTPSTTE